MNAARQVISRRLVSAAGPRLTTPIRYSSTSVGHSGTSSQDTGLMRAIFTGGTLATAGAVIYGATRSGGRVNGRFSQKKSTEDSTKWFKEGSDIDHLVAAKH